MRFQSGNAVFKFLGGRSVGGTSVKLIGMLGTKQVVVVVMYQAL